MVAKTRAMAFALALAFVAVVSVIEGALAQASPAYVTVATDGTPTSARTLGRDEYAYFQFSLSAKNDVDVTVDVLDGDADLFVLRPCVNAADCARVPSDAAYDYPSVNGHGRDEVFVRGADLDENLDVGSTKYFRIGVHGWSAHGSTFTLAVTEVPNDRALSAAQTHIGCHAAYIAFQLGRIEQHGAVLPGEQPRVRVDVRDHQAGPLDRAVDQPDRHVLPRQTGDRVVGLDLDRHEPLGRRRRRDVDLFPVAAGGGDQGRDRNHLGMGGRPGRRRPFAIVTGGGDQGQPGNRDDGERGALHAGRSTIRVPGRGAAVTPHPDDHGGAVPPVATAPASASARGAGVHPGGHGVPLRTSPDRSPATRR